MPDCKPPAVETAPGAPTCPSTCKDGAALKLYKAKSAYMVAKPGDVRGMQKEIMQNGPIEVLQQSTATAVVPPLLLLCGNAGGRTAAATTAASCLLVLLPHSDAVHTAAVVGCLLCLLTRPKVHSSTVAGCLLRLLGLPDVPVWRLPPHAICRGPDGRPRSAYSRMGH